MKSSAWAATSAPGGDIDGLKSWAGDLSSSDFPASDATSASGDGIEGLKSWAGEWSSSDFPASGATSAPAPAASSTA
ncbi:hypothetical protein [Cardiobacterium hominis]|uniref:hypothetical protein n=1 Tax=Cardiobacterium hominis TaxID=2718 RepID=UPI000A6377CA|nr:hypothetical protein [Cardiobacterium hominis]